MSMATQRTASGAVDMDVDSGLAFRWRDAAAWGVSLGAHFVIFAMLATITYSVSELSHTEITSALDEVDEERYKFETTISDQIGSDSNIDTLIASQEAAQNTGQTPQEEMKQKIDELNDVVVPVTDEIVQPAAAEMLSTVQTQGATEHTGGVEGAVDRLAWEIANQLREKKTLVVWLFDVSPSLKERREVVAGRVENIYKQLTQLTTDSEKALKTAVASFSERTTVITDEPVDTAEDVVKAVRGIKSEESGRENVFSAVQMVINKFLPYRTKQKRSVMVIIVTDEAGSDSDRLEQTIQLARRYGIKCYCVGDAAPFGRRDVEIPFTLENGETVVGVMTRGPESYYPELLQLGFWPSGDIELTSSGFGPYGLTRLCAETNGLFFLSSETGVKPKDPQLMRNYSPDYRPIPMIDADIKANAAKRVLTELAIEQNSSNALRFPYLQLAFRADTDNALRGEITEAQRPVAELDYRLEQLQNRLALGEKDRANVAEPRWQASYDLAMGRALAMRVRAFGYNTMLAEMKATPKKFENAGSNRWRLVPSKEISSGAAVRKLAKQATDYLTRVVDDHPGTPWADLAERELVTQFGWEWKEDTFDYARAAEMAAERKAGPRIIEEVDPKTGKKVKRVVGGEPKRLDI